MRLNRLSAILDDQVPIRVMADRVLLALSELFTADVVALLLAPQPGSRDLQALAAIGLPEGLGDEFFSGDDDGYAAIAMRGRSPVLVDSAQEDERMDSRLRELGVETAVWLPIPGSLGALGTLVLALQPDSVLPVRRRLADRHGVPGGPRARASYDRRGTGTAVGNAQAGRED